MCIHLFELYFCLSICPGVGLLDHMAVLGGFSGSLAGKESTCSAGGPSSIPGS